MALVVKNLLTNAGDVRDVGSIPGQEGPLEEWQPTPAFLPGKSHGQRSLAGYSSWGPNSQTRLSNVATCSHVQCALWENKELPRLIFYSNLGSLILDLPNVP